MLKKFSLLSEELSVVLPISFFEKANNAHYNSLVCDPLVLVFGLCFSLIPSLLSFARLFLIAESLLVSIASRTFLMAPVIKRSFISILEILAFRSGRPVSERSEWVFAGINGSLNALE
jgi:hypothetical protein